MRGDLFFDTEELLSEYFRECDNYPDTEGNRKRGKQMQNIRIK